MKTSNRQHSYFELTTITILIFIASFQAFEWSLAGIIPIAHAFFILSLYLLIRLLLSRTHALAGEIVFAGTALLFLSEIAIYQITGLHLNRFVLSLLFQPEASDQIGISGYSLLAGILGIFLLSLWLSKKLSKPTFVLKARFLLISATVSLAITQGIFSLLYFHGQSDVVEVKRELPFFMVPHAYYGKLVFGLIWDIEEETPFGYKPQLAVSKKPVSIQVPIFKRKKNVLLIVTDSLRAEDIKQNPQIAPNLATYFKDQYQSYEHYSTANCTHFSFYSVLTGKLSTSFGSSRRSGGQYSLMKAFAGNGYKISTSEATSLDWYDIAGTLFPASTDRTVEGINTKEAYSDIGVTKDTLEKLATYKKEEQAFFHLAYYYGNHFPYNNGIKNSDLSLIERYHHSIRSFDHEMGELLKSLKNTGQLNNTLIIITSDHGEEINEAGLIGHSSRLSDAQIKVPFWSMGLPNEYTSGIKSHTDITPAILNYMQDIIPPQNLEPIILTNCDYDFPNQFSVIRNNSRTDFTYDNGYLSPASLEHQKHTKKQQLDDAILLLKIIKEAEIQPN